MSGTNTEYMACIWARIGPWGNVILAVAIGFAQPCRVPGAEPAERPDDEASATLAVDKGQPAAAPHTRPSPDTPAAAPTAAGTLKFNFRHAPWEDVLRWLADELDLSFSLDVVPTGTFNYVDEGRTFTEDQSLDLVNSYLLIKGYTLIRRDKMLLIIDLEDDVDRQLVRDLLTETPVRDLSSRGQYEITKTRFSLDRVDPASAEQQLKSLLGPSGSLLVFPQAKQIVATDTGGTLRTMHDILLKLEETAAAASSSLFSFKLNVATADEVLMIARPLLGLADDSNAAQDGSVRLSADPLGRTVFVTGTPEKIGLVRQIVQQVDGDNGQAATAQDNQAAQFMVHPLRTADPQGVLRVLQTLFAGDPVVRLEVDGTGSIVAMARPAQHRSIQATIAEMEQAPQRVTVIPLHVSDPAAVIILIEKMFSKSAVPPIVDGTSQPRQLVIRASNGQLLQIRELLKSLGEVGDEPMLAAGRGGNLRMIPVDANVADDLLRRVSEIWPTLRRNPLRVVDPSAPDMVRPMQHQEDPGRRHAPPASRVPLPRNSLELDGVLRTEPVAGPVQMVSRLDAEGASVVSPDDGSDEDVAADDTGADLPPVMVTPSAGGLMITSADSAALDVLQSLFTALAGRMANVPRFHLFYLKHIEAEATRELLVGIISGTATTSPISSAAPMPVASSTPPARGSNPPGPGAVAASALSLSGSGIPHMVADRRLNALFVQGSDRQLEIVTQLLQAIDVESGPEDVLTFPRPRFIPVQYARAADVAEVLKQVYAHRLEVPSTGGRGGNPGDFFRGFRGPFFGGFEDRGREGRGGGGGGGDARPADAGGTAGQLPKLTIGVDAASNSIVVSAPGPLLKEVEAVVQDIDRRASRQPAETVVVATLKRSSPQAVQAALAQVFGGSVTTGNASASNARSTAENRSGRNGRAQSPQPTNDFENFRPPWLRNAPDDSGRGNESRFGAGRNRDRQENAPRGQRSGR